MNQTPERMPDRQDLRARVRAAIQVREIEPEDVSLEIGRARRIVPEFLDGVYQGNNDVLASLLETWLLRQPVSGDEP